MTHLLCKNGEDWGQWDVISASSDKSVLQAAADRLEQEDYARLLDQWERGGKRHGRPLAPDDPERMGYRTFYVIEVSDWPLVEGAQ